MYILGFIFIFAVINNNILNIKKKMAKTILLNKNDFGKLTFLMFEELLGTKLNDNNKHLAESIIRAKLNEYYGVDYTIRDGNIVFYMNDSHQDNVDTNNPSNPIPFVTTLNGETLYSIFMKLNGRFKGDKLSGSTSAIDAMKGKEGYDYGDEATKINVYQRIEMVLRAIPESFDTVIKVTSTHYLNDDFFEMVKRNIKANNFYDGIFRKYTALEIFNIVKDMKWYNDGKNIKAIKFVNKKFEQMIANNELFSYRKLGPLPYRKLMPISVTVNNGILRSEDINGKRILIIDDVASSGKTLSDSTEALRYTFEPRKVSYLTIFSPINNIKLNVEKK